MEKRFWVKMIKYEGGANSKRANNFSFFLKIWEKLKVFFLAGRNSNHWWATPTADSVKKI